MRTRPVPTGTALIVGLIATSMLAACASSGGTGRGTGAPRHPGTASLTTSTSSSDDVPSRAALVPKPSAHGAAPICETVPSSSGPIAHLVHVTIDAPATAASGAAVSVSPTITSSSTLPRVIATPATSALLVVQGGQVVGGVRARSTAELPLQLSAGMRQPAQVVPNSVRLVHCGSGVALGAGDYSLVAVLGYRVDSLNAAPDDGSPPPYATGRSFVLVSARAPISIS